MWADCRAQTGAIVGGGNKVSPVPAYHMGAQYEVWYREWHLGGINQC